MYAENFIVSDARYYPAHRKHTAPMINRKQSYFRIKNACRRLGVPDYIIRDVAEDAYTMYTKVYKKYGQLRNVDMSKVVACVAWSLRAGDKILKKLGESEKEAAAIVFNTIGKEEPISLKKSRAQSLIKISKHMPVEVQCFIEENSEEVAELCTRLRAYTFQKKIAVLNIIATVLLERVFRARIVTINSSIVSYMSNIARYAQEHCENSTIFYKIVEVSPTEHVYARDVLKSIEISNAYARLYVLLEAEKRKISRKIRIPLSDHIVRVAEEFGASTIYSTAKYSNAPHSYKKHVIRMIENLEKY